MSWTKWFAATTFVALLVFGCSGDANRSTENVGSTSQAVAYCENDQVVTLDSSDSYTYALSGTYTGYIPSTITTTTGVPAQFSAQLSLQINSGLTYPDGGPDVETCVYNYTSSGAYFVTPVNACVPPPGEACSYVYCPANPVGYHFSGVTNVAVTLTRVGGSTPLVANAEFGDNPIDDGNVCTVDSCSGTSATHVAETPGTSCSDENLCNGTETCNASAVCVSSGNAPSGTPCPDNNVCNGAEACNGSGSCVSPGNAPDGTPCPNSTVCDGAETCSYSTGTCNSGTSLVVPASTTCTTSSCDAVLGIVTSTSTSGACASSYQPTGSAEDPTIPTDFAGSTSFLYTGSSPIQTGVSSGTIVAGQAAVIRGRVLDVDGFTPLSGATVSILNHSEFGSTLSRLDGNYDLAVNGGTGYVVDLQLSGRLEAQRAVSTTWHDYAVVDDIILVPRDTTAPATVTNVTSSSQFTVGPTVSDDAGTRHANLYIPANTSVHGYSSSTYTLRATEFTNGALGRLMMPGTLPPQSAYTYAVDYSIDGLSAGVTFDYTDPSTLAVTPGTVYSYTENYLSIPVGSAVPAGYYDTTSGKWVASANGDVILILNSSGDVNYTGAKTGSTYNTETSTAQSAIGLSSDERATITAQYGAGAQLWRVPMQHFTGYDLNWGFSIPSDALPPPFIPPFTPLPPDDPCLGSGSIIECQSQILAEEIPVFGTPYTLRYQSERVAGRGAKITVPISANTATPGSLSRVDVQIAVAGKSVVISTPAPIATNQSITWTWDRLDAYGRQVQGSVPADIKVSYVYAGVTGAEPLSFGGYPLITLSTSENPVAREIAFYQEYQIYVGGFEALSLGFGGWSLSAEHVYDQSGVLYRGDGRRQTEKAKPAIISTVAGGGYYYDASSNGRSATLASIREIQGMAVGQDGSLYFADSSDNVIHKVDPTGTISTFAGSYSTSAGTFMDGALATSVPMQPWSLTVGPDNYLYVGEDSGNAHRVLKIALTGSPYTYLVAGHRDSSVSGYGSYGGDGGSATSATLDAVTSTAVSSEGIIYIGTGSRVRMITPDGIIATIAGNGNCSPPPYDGTATSRGICPVQGVAIGPDGALYIATANSGYSNRIRRLTADGTLTTVAGGHNNFGYTTIGDGGPALSATISPGEIHFGADGGLYAAYIEDSIIQRIDLGGAIHTFAGTASSPSYSGDGGAATAARMGQATSFAFAPDGSMYIADPSNQVVRHVYFDGGRSGTNLELASDDSDDVYEFDSSGRHLYTVSALRGAVRRQLYYTSGLLTSIADSGNTTTITRTSGKVLITSQFGQSTTLNLDTNGYLSSVVLPDGVETYNLSHTSTGLLTTFQKPNGATSTFTYATDGRLLTDKDAMTSTPGQSLSQVVSAAGYSVSMQSAQGLSKQFSEDFSVSPAPTVYPGSTKPAGTQNELRTFLSPAGLTNTDTRLTDGSKVVSLADGTLTWQQFTPDPRFGTATAYQSGLTTQKGSHTRVQKTLTAASLSSPTDPLSLISWTTTDCVNGTGAPTTCSGGSMTSTTFTSSTNQEVTTLPTGRQVTRTFDSSDRVVGVQINGTSPVGLNAVSYAYDTHGRLYEVTQGSRSYQVSYDGTTGFITSVEDNALGITTTNTGWDGEGRPTAVTLPGGYSLSKTYDADGNLASLTMPDSTSNLHDLEWNVSDLLGEYDPPSSGASTYYNYNFDHNLAALLDPDGTTVYLRDPTGRLYSDGRTSYAYSSSPATGLLTSKTAGTESRTYGYDGPLVSSVTIASTATPSYSYALALTHDNYFRVTARQLGSLPAINFTYYADDLLNTATATSGTTYTINRSEGSSGNGLVASTVLGSVTETPTFDGYGALSNDSYGTSVYTVAYTRDAGGRVTQKVETVSGTATTTTYVYDGTTGCPTTANDGRLYEATIGGTTYGPYTYDADGNRTDIAGYSYDSQDRMQTFNGNSYTYTPGGRLLTNSTASINYTYDVFGNLTRVLPTTGSEIDYVIDPDNRRVGKKVGGTFVQGFVYNDIGQLVAELKGDGTVVSQFIYGTKQNVPDYMINTISGTSTTYRIISDQLGSVVMVVNAASPTGTPAQTITYDPWGKILTEADNVSNGNTAISVFQPFGFAGGLHDRDTGFVRFGARDYDPATGRWTNKDPIRFDGGLNVYVYCSEDPINCIDPLGTDPGDPWTLEWFTNNFCYYTGLFCPHDSGGRPGGPDNGWVGGKDNSPPIEPANDNGTEPVACVPSDRKPPGKECELISSKDSTNPSTGFKAGKCTYKCPLGTVTKYVGKNSVDCYQPENFPY